MLRNRTKVKVELSSPVMRCVLLRFCVGHYMYQSFFEVPHVNICRLEVHYGQICPKKMSEMKLYQIKSLRRFFESPFRPKIIRIDFHPKIITQNTTK
jgi:hypothetical protein